MVVRPAFVQALLARRVVRRGEAAAMHAQIAEAAGVHDADLDADLAALHTSLARLGLDLRACHDQRTGEPFLVLVNAKADTLAEIATPYSAVELVYIKSVVRRVCADQIEAIVTHPCFALRSTDALHLAGPAQLTKRAASDLLQNLEQRGWLQLQRSSGHYTLTLRALNELDTYLRNAYEEHLLECVACFALVTYGEQCATPGCRAALHTACRQWRAAEEQRSCPRCGTPWQARPVGDGRLAD